MKKFFVVFLVAASFGHFAVARSIRNVRLNFQEVPTSSPVATHSISVFADGEIAAYQCSPLTLPKCTKKTLGHYSARQINEIDRLIEEARDGRIVKSPISAKCFVAPFKTDRYSADNDSVFLKSGHICTAIYYNNSSAAKKLLKTLEKLQRLSVSSPDNGGTLCPKPGTTINCMPPTTIPYCRPATRNWIQSHCPDVHFLD